MRITPHISHAFVPSGRHATWWMRRTIALGLVLLFSLVPRAALADSPTFDTQSQVYGPYPSFLSNICGVEIMEVDAVNLTTITYANGTQRTVPSGPLYSTFTSAYGSLTARIAGTQTFIQNPDGTTTIVATGPYLITAPGAGVIFGGTGRQVGIIGPNGFTPVSQVGLSAGFNWDAPCPYLSPH